MSDARRPRAVRFVRALALVGGASMGCSASDTTPNPVAVNDATIDDAIDASVDTKDTAPGEDVTVVFDVSDAQETDVGPHGSCYWDLAGAALCPPGTFCDWDGLTPPRCVRSDPSDVDAANDEPCGMITCVGEHQCFCLMEATSFCECGISGPLPPPDLAEKPA